MTTFDPTEEQQAILAHPLTEHARILAGPGTGKSATVVALLNEALSKGADPNRVRLLTFTRAATGELALKVAEQPSARVLRPSTIHSFAISILLRNPGMGGFPEPLRIADGWEERWIVRETLKNRSGFSIDYLRKLFQWMQSGWESLEKNTESPIPEADRIGFESFWEESRAVFGYTLLSELPYRLRAALQQYPEVEGSDLDALIVDEYQDLNACDLEVLHMLADKGCAIIAAGDDDQSIYRMRNAAPAGIRRFPEEYPGSGDYPLSVSIRCGIRLIEWANHVIQNDTSRPRGKAVLRPNENAPPGEVALLSFGNQNDEARGVARIVRSIRDHEGVPESEIVILVRADHNRRFSSLLKPELEKLKITVTDPASVSDCLNEPDNRAFLARVRLLCHREDSLAWATVFHLARGVGPKFHDAVYQRARNSNRTFGQSILELAETFFEGVPSQHRALAYYQEVTDWLNRQDVPEETPPDGWSSWILALADDEQSSLELSEYFRWLVSNLDQRMEEDTNLDRFVSRIEPLGKDFAQSQSRGVRIMTMGASKGLTVTAVVLVGVEEQIIPHPLADREEESRLLYVAMTRARSYLYVTWARQRWGQTARGDTSGKARRPSTFISSGPVKSQDGNRYIAERFPSS